MTVLRIKEAGAPPVNEQRLFAGPDALRKPSWLSSALVGAAPAGPDDP